MVVASNAFSTKVAFITTVIEGHGRVSLLSKFYFCDPSLILICRKSASSPSPFLLLVSAVGFREPLAQSAGAALRVKKHLSLKGSTVTNCKINFASSVAVLRDSVPHTLSPGKAVLEEKSCSVICCERPSKSALKNPR